jgi:hypothetical protein
VVGQGPGTFRVAWLWPKCSKSGADPFFRKIVQVLKNKSSLQIEYPLSEMIRTKNVSDFRGFQIFGVFAWIYLLSVPNLKSEMP